MQNATGLNSLTTQIVKLSEHNDLIFDWSKYLDLLKNILQYSQSLLIQLSHTFKISISQFPYLIFSF